jgi:long-chain-fatty-acid--CoA ligase ACSBG
MLRGRTIFQGYLNDEAKTVETIEEDGWLHTGDIGCIDNEGFVYITGRIKVFLRPIEQLK